MIKLIAQIVWANFKAEVIVWVGVVKYDGPNFEEKTIWERPISR